MAYGCGRRLPNRLFTQHRYPGPHRSYCDPVVNMKDWIPDVITSRDAYEKERRMSDESRCAENNGLPGPQARGRKLPRLCPILLGAPLPALATSRHSISTGNLLLCNVVHESPTFPESQNESMSHWRCFPYLLSNPLTCRAV